MDTARWAHLAGVISSVVVVTVLPSAAAQAGPSRTHVCAVDRPAAPAVPPPLAMPATSARGDSAGPQEPAPPKRAAEEPILMMGCVLREHPLREARLPDAQNAVSLAEAPQSAAAIYKFESPAYKFESPADRDHRVGEWLAAMEPAASTPGAPVSAVPTNDYIGGWQNARWSFPGMRVVHAIFPENGRSGKVCLVRTDLNGRPEALAALNNWCMDTLGLWAD